MKRTLLLTTALVLCAATAQADEKFSAMDTNKDGFVTWEEFEVGYPQMRKPAFEAIDADKDNKLSHEEWDGFRNRHGQGGKGMGGEGMGEGMPKGMGGGMPPAGMGGAMPKGKMPLVAPPTDKAAPQQAPKGMVVEPPKQ